jgi:hypothetical protein
VLNPKYTKTPQLTRATPGLHRKFQASDASVVGLEFFMRLFVVGVYPPCFYGL